MRSFAALKELASILDTADEKHIAAGEPTYDQKWTMHECGTPACALGHWLHAHPEHRYHRDEKTFEITTNEWDALFSIEGCGKARTSKEAAGYIRSFIARKQREESVGATA